MDRSKQENDKELLLALKDLGMKQKDIESFVQDFHSGNTKRNKKQIEDARLEILKNIHKDQDQLYLADFISQKWLLKNNKEDRSDDHQ